MLCDFSGILKVNLDIEVAFPTFRMLLLSPLQG